MRKRLNRPRGPRPAVSDTRLLKFIQEVQICSKFNEGYRKIRARLRRRGVRVSETRLRRVMRTHELFRFPPPERPRIVVPRHTGTRRITTTAPNLLWGMDSASVLTRRDGELALFFVMEHWNSECLGWYLSRGSDKEGAVNAMSAALEHLGVERIPGLTLRVDHWTGFRSPEFIHHLEQADIGLSLSFPMRPWQNGVAERFVRTIREQLLSLAEFVSFHDAVQAIGEFMHNYNHHWLLGRLGFLSPAERRFSFQELRA